MGDLNVKVGSDNINCMRYMGIYGFGVCNENGE